MASTDSRPVPRKNVAYRAYFPILDNTGALVSGAAGLDSEYSIDGGNFADCTNEATEVQSTGLYYLDLVQAEMNGDAVVVQVKTSTTDAKPTVLIFYPEEAGDFRADVTHFGGSALTSAAGIPEVKVASIANNAIAAAAIASDAITAAKLHSDVTTELQSGLATAANLATVAGYLDTEIADIKAKTDNLPSDPADASVVAGLIAGVVADTEDIQSRLPAALTADGNMKADALRVGGTVQTAQDLGAFVAAIFGDTTDLKDRVTAAVATALQAHTLGLGRGVVDAGSSTTEVVFKSINGGAASATNDFYNGRMIIFTSGALTLQATSIADYDGASATATVPALTGAPAEDVNFVIV